jgi:hypothetical protein
MSFNLRRNKLRRGILLNFFLVTILVQIGFDNGLNENHHGIVRFKY